MSEDEACRRIHAARLARRFPDLLVRIERGELTLSTIAILQDALTSANYEELVQAAAGKSKSEVRALLAKRAPAPDVPTAITTIPAQPAIPAPGFVPSSAPATWDGPQLAPLSEIRHKVQFTASDELRKKLERARDLMRHANADGDLAVVVERAVDLLLGKLEKQRLGQTAAPAAGSVPRPSGSGESTRSGRSTVPRAARREVFERDGERCTFTDAEGRRCEATGWLELDHIDPRGRGGTDRPGNLRVRCRAHNQLHAEQTFGKEHVRSKIRERRDPRRRVCDAESCEQAASALLGLGFRRVEVQRALVTVTARHEDGDLSMIPVQTIVHEALRVLSSAG